MVPRSLEGHLYSVHDCTYSPDGKQIVSASYDQTLKVWDVVTSKILRTLEGHSASVSCCAYSPDGKHIVSASYDHTLKVWDVTTGEILRTLDRGLRCTPGAPWFCQARPLLQMNKSAGTLK
jgi:WD40 repeat protein